MNFNLLKSAILVVALASLGCQKDAKEEAAAAESKAGGVDRTQVEHRVWLPKEVKHVSQVVSDTNKDVWVVTTDEQLVHARREKPPEIKTVDLGEHPVDVSWVGVLGDQLWVVASVEGHSVAGVLDRDSGRLTVLELPHEPRELAWSQGVLWYLSTDAHLYRHKAGESQRQGEEKFLFLMGAGRTLIARQLQDERLMARQEKTGKWGPIHDYGGVPIGLGPDDGLVQWVRGEETGDETPSQNRLVINGADLLSGAIQAAAATADSLAIVRREGTRAVLEWRDYRL